MPKHSLIVNDTSLTIEAEDEMPLLWALRDIAGLTGTKYGCGIGQCGACTVHLNGNPVRSCSINIKSVTNQHITTIEGLASEASLNLLQEVWIEEDVAQCGYCQTGQIMSAAALLKVSPNPDDDEIDAAMSGNYCRCGTYVRIRKAIHVAAERGQIENMAKKA